MSQHLRMSLGPSQEPPDEDADVGADRGGGDFRDEPRSQPRDEIPRRETGLRILLTVLFVIVAGVIESVLAVVVLFELVVALVLQRPPSPRVRDFANRVIGYYYRIGRYLTYNDSLVPFPFSEFPEPLEPDDWDPDDSAADALGIAARPARPDAEDDLGDEDGAR